ncbi:hypothetical protein BWI17_00610 [Betaproteobacteria bacterium GR16-43]|nr:hypothetical protein BWI17_00610 [Betaproteobacteria bacterium GR16-43]
MLARMLAPMFLAVSIQTLASDVTFGRLPPGATSTNVVTDVSAEICRDHLFAPSLIVTRLPKDYRLVLAAEYAREDPGVADLIKSNVKYSTYAVGSLCFMSVGSFLVDGVRVHSAGPTPMAFWWARAAGPRDSRMQGKVDWLQLASWYSRDVIQREKVLATDPMALFVDLSVTQAEPGLWRMRLELPNESIEAEVLGSGQRKKRNAPQPGFMTVPFTGESAGSFWVITYFGHHHQAAKGQWRAKGAGVFSDALQIPGEASVFRTSFQDGWSALSGLYGPVQ